MCLGAVVIKNTFVCVLDTYEDSSPSLHAVRSYRRSQSENNVCSNTLKTQGEGLLIGGSADDVAEAEEEPAEENCFVQWTRALEVRGCEASAAIAEIASHTATLAFDPLGSQVLQRALEVASPVEACYLASRLHGLVVEAARSPYASAVLETVVHRLSSKDAAFIAQEMQGCGRAVALNAYGCTVVCRLLEFSAQEPSVSALVDEVLAQDPAALCCHKFGHRVAMSIISNASERQGSQIVAALRQGGLQRLARHRFATRVLEHVLSQGSNAEAQALATELMAQAGAVVSLACHSFGVQVVRGILEVPQESKMALHYLEKAVRKLSKDKYGSMLVEELGLHDSEIAVVSAAAVGGA